MKTLQSIRIALIVAGIGLFGHSTQAQQHIQYTQYMYNTGALNPAYTGTSNQLNVFMMHRSQWVGLSGAPNTQNLGVDYAVNDKLGLGLNFIKDRIGPTNDCILTFNSAVRLPVTANSKIALGLSGGVDFLSVDFTQGQAQDPNDPMLANNINNRVRPQVGAGVYYYSDHWYVGASVPNFLLKDNYNGAGQPNIDQNAHTYIIGGYVFDINEKLKFKPATMAKIVQGARPSLDLSMNFLINNQFTTGAAYRMNDAISILLGYTYKNQLFFGYSYDITVTKLRSFNSGSHDISLRYSLLKKQQRARSPRFF